MTMRTQLHRRSFILGSLAASVGAGRPARAQPVSKPSNVTVMTWGGEYGDVDAAAGKVFEAQTGIKVIQDRGSSPVERIAKVKINAQNQIYDIVELHDGLVPLAVKEGAYEPVDLSSARLLNLASIPPIFITPHWIAFIFSDIGICWNAKEVAGTPASYADLWRPEFKGRAIFPAITHSIGPYIVPIGAMADGKNPNDEKAGFERLKQLSGLDPIWARDTDGIMNALLSGEAVIGLLYRSQFNTLIQRGGTSLRWAAPKEGAIQISWGAGIAKGCRNKEAAEIYLNFLLSPEGQAPFARAFNYPGTNPKSIDILPKDLQDRVRLDPETFSKLVTFDHQFIAGRRAAWTEQWNRIVAQ
jgi:putative spermidine/putrescine transport system substrate-binding protein